MGLRGLSLQRLRCTAWTRHSMSPELECSAPLSLLILWDPSIEILKQPFKEGPEVFINGQEE